MAACVRHTLSLRVTCCRLMNTAGGGGWTCDFWPAQRRGPLHALTQGKTLRCAPVVIPCNTFNTGQSPLTARFAHTGIFVTNSGLRAGLVKRRHWRLQLQYMSSLHEAFSAQQLPLLASSASPGAWWPGDVTQTDFLRTALLHHAQHTQRNSCDRIPHKVITSQLGARTSGTCSPIDPLRQNPV